MEPQILPQRSPWAHRSPPPLQPTPNQRLSFLTLPNCLPTAQKTLQPTHKGLRSLSSPLRARNPLQTPPSTTRHSLPASSRSSRGGASSLSPVSPSPWALSGPGAGRGRAGSRAGGGAREGLGLRWARSGRRHREPARRHTAPRAQAAPPPPAVVRPAPHTHGRHSGTVRPHSPAPGQRGGSVHLRRDAGGLCEDLAVFPVKLGRDRWSRAAVIGQGAIKVGCEEKLLPVSTELWDCSKPG